MPHLGWIPPDYGMKIEYMPELKQIVGQQRYIGITYG